MLFNNTNYDTEGVRYCAIFDVINSPYKIKAAVSQNHITIFEGSGGQTVHPKLPLKTISVPDKSGR